MLFNQGGWIGLKTSLKNFWKIEPLRRVPKNGWKYKKKWDPVLNICLNCFYSLILCSLLLLAKLFKAFSSSLVKEHWWQLCLRYWARTVENHGISYLIFLSIINLASQHLLQFQFYIYLRVNWIVSISQLNQQLRNYFNHHSSLGSATLSHNMHLM